MKPGVYITVDVECSMGGAWADPALRPVAPSRTVWGRFGDRKLGLPRIADILGEHGLKATFFVEAFMAEQGHPDGPEPICHYLLERGHDVQLHIHPNHKHYGMKQRGQDAPFTDQMADLPPQSQRELLKEGADRIEAWTGRRPVAFRAGNMGASEETLQQLPAARIRIDSSYTFPYLGGQCKFAERESYNGTKWYGDVLEVALSGFRQVRLPGLHPSKPLDLMGICFEECRDAVRQISAAGADSVLILHSFSLLKVRNVQYEGGRVNRIVSRRFARLCQWLAGNASQYPSYTFRGLAEALARGEYEAKAVPPCALHSPLRSLVRKAVQAYNGLHWT